MIDHVSGASFGPGYPATPEPVPVSALREGIPSAVWVVRWEANWGTRLPRRFFDYYFAVEPSKEGAVNFLCSEGFPARVWSAPISIFAVPLWRCPAQAIEARRAETQSGSVHESAVGNADAPNPQQESHQ